MGYEGRRLWIDGLRGKTAKDRCDAREDGKGLMEREGSGEG